MIFFDGRIGFQKVGMAGNSRPGARVIGRMLARAQAKQRTKRKMAA
ncbi:hypothetical protein [Camelimonas sp. ID_303_24]